MNKHRTSTPSVTVPGLFTAAFVGLATPGLLAASQPAAQIEAAPPSEPAPAADQPVPAPAEAQPTGRGLSVSFTPYGERTFAADIDDSEGSVSIWRAGGILSFRGPLGDRAGWGFTGVIEHSYYDFDNATELFPVPPAERATGSPFNDVWGMDLVPSLQYVIDDRWSVRGGLLLEFAGEPGADIGDSFSYGGAISGRYRFSDTLSFGFGISAKTRLEDDPIVIPILSASWQINERLSLTSESPRGPGVTLRAQATEHIAVLLTAAFEFRDYRLESDSPLPDGVVSDERVKIGTGIEWKPTPRLSVLLEGGAVVWQQFEVFDSDGDDVSEREADPAAYISLSGSINW